MTLFEELKRRKVFKVGAGYLVVAWLAVQAASIGFPAFDAPPWALRIFILVVFLGFPISLVFAWAFDVTPEGVKAGQSSRLSKVILISAVALAALAFTWYFKGQPAYLDEAERGEKTASAENAQAATPAKAVAAISKKSIAVLPFTDLSPNHDQEYFSDGIAEEILNALAQVKDLKVAGRTSSFHFKGKNDDLREIGRTLGVAHILEGSVRKQGDQVRITAQLIQTADGFHLWSESYDGDLKDVFQLQEDIARSITDKLQVILQGEQSQRLVLAPTQNTEAYSLYLQASQVFNRREGARFPEAIAQLEQALRLDPKFARAHSRLAAMQSLAPNYDQRVIASSAAATEEHARKAIALDATLAEPYAALGALYTRQRRYVDTFAVLKKAVAIDPNDVTANFWLATALCTTGYLKRCDEQLDRVLALDPLMPNALAWRGVSYVRTGELDKAASVLKRAKEAGLVHIGISQSVLDEARGNLPEAEADLMQGYAPFTNEFPAGSLRTMVHGVFGDAKARATAVEATNRYLAGKPKPVSAIAIYVLLRTGAPQVGLAAALQGPTSNEAILLNPVWDNTHAQLRAMPEFSQFARGMGLASLWDQVGPPDLCQKNGKGDYVCK
ncbi:MAG: hypothetical protein KAY03_02310 [Arenimonas sp.]|nr:hypothetical protein [Arenimonas sp.]